MFLNVVRLEYERSLPALITGFTNKILDNFATSLINNVFDLDLFLDLLIQKQPSRGALRKRCSENIQQIYRRTPTAKCDFNKVALQLY